MVYIMTTSRAMCFEVFTQSTNLVSKKKQTGFQTAEQDRGGVSSIRDSAPPILDRSPQPKTIDPKIQRGLFPYFYSKDWHAA
ncbi:hypothetical protein RRG08_012046 [Elysia crispata]|uniref:Uncharacterized protein n=1 Tax=Elysia crispata TaxID=231223 RepID=A0AAE0XVR5_9GAST|nr:hypothetical protein RRG08_012046 [Elysia crispata]